MFLSVEQSTYREGRLLSSVLKKLIIVAVSVRKMDVTTLIHQQTTHVHTVPSTPITSVSAIHAYT